MKKFVFFIIVLSFLSSSILIYGNDINKKRLAIIPFPAGGGTYLDGSLGDGVFDNFVETITTEKPTYKVFKDIKFVPSADGGWVVLSSNNDILNNIKLKNFEDIFKDYKDYMKPPLNVIDENSYNIISKKIVTNALTQLKLRLKGINKTNALAVGKNVGASIVIWGSVNFSSNTYYINIRAVDVATENIIFQSQKEAKNENDLAKVASELAKDISQSISQSETVVYGTYKSSIVTATTNATTDEVNVNKNLDIITTKPQTSVKTIDFNLEIFNLKEQAFVKRYYSQWGFYPDNYEMSKKKANGFNAGGGVLVGFGTVSLLLGFIFMVVGWHEGPYYTSEEYYYNGPWDNGYRTVKRIGTFNSLLGIAGIPIFIIGLFMLPFASAPFWFASMVKKIYQKATGTKLTFWERSNFDIKIVEARDTITNELNRKISFDLSIKL